MSVVDKILLAADIITALTVIVALLVSIYKFFRFLITKEEHDRENYLNILRLTIMSEEMPLEERIAAGDKYIAAGGNGAVKHKYQELLEKL
ncbi:MAG: hypothetical protein ACI4LI_00225 [Candidatus Fimenecus sp.]